MELHGQQMTFNKEGTEVGITWTSIEFEWLCKVKMVFKMELHGPHVTFGEKKGLKLKLHGLQ